MTENEGDLFVMLDNYVKLSHHWHVTEFFHKMNQPVYIVCFRPQDPLGDEPMFLNCVYLRIGLQEARTMWSEKSLSNAIVQELEEKITKICQERNIPKVQQIQ
jgi:hypothetical protein